MCWLCTVGWCQHRPLMEVHHPATLEQSCCKNLVFDWMSFLLVWLLHKSGSSDARKELA